MTRLQYLKIKSAYVLLLGLKLKSFSNAMLNAGVQLH